VDDRVGRFLTAWALITAVLCSAVFARARIDPAPMPAHGAQRWALQALAATRTGSAPPPPPAEAGGYRARGPIVFLAWSRGRVQARYVGGGDLVPSVQRAAESFAADDLLSALRPPLPGERDSVHFTIDVTRGSAPFVRGVPLLENLGVVPLLEGVVAQLGEQRAFLTPDELRADGLFDSVVTPIPDLAFGVDVRGIEARLAAQLGVTRDELVARGTLHRLRTGTISARPYPSHERPDLAALERAAREGALFLLRHQHDSGRYTYVYRGQDGREAVTRYNLPRHAGTTYFLAQAARVLGMPEAREGALRALRWLRRTALRRCGGSDLLCISDRPRADMGSAALTALAAAELLRGGDDPQNRRLLLGLTRFIRSMQRSDGELMHDYDLDAARPIDVQRMYYSGEAAYALLASYRVFRDERDLTAARRLMRHLTGAGWNFFGSRYFYGEEHWTCQAVSQAAQLMRGMEQGIDFCTRWLAFQRVLQYGPGQTAWPVHGAIGVGPLLVPRLTTVASRTETGAMFYPVAARLGRDARVLRAQVEASLGFLLRMSWLPGPAHALFAPEAAFGGVPGSPQSLEVRNDFVQHAGSAMLLWAEVLRAEHDAGK
jgi:hypothetical protein